jgi:hypothetical protein
MCLVLFRAAAVVALASFVSATAAAQTTPPAPQPAPGLEAGDTAAPPGAPPAPAPGTVTPVAPLPGPAVAPAPSTIEAPLVVPVPPAPRPPRFYQTHWFWGAVAVVVATGIVVLALTLNNADPATPNTRLGDMRAF